MLIRVFALRGWLQIVDCLQFRPYCYQGDVDGDRRYERTGTHVAPQIVNFQSKVTADLIAEYLRERILDGTYAPSTNINEVQLAAHLNISRGPLREAVQRLVQEGLLLCTRNYGTSVVDLGTEDIEDIYKARVAIEVEAGRLVLQEDTDELAAELNTILQRMHNALEEDRWQDVAAEDVNFHQTIVQATRSPRLARMFSTLAAETLLCIRQFRHIHGCKETVLEQHRRLQELIRAGDQSGYLAEIEWHLKESVPMLEAARKHAVPDLVPMPAVSAN